AEQALAAMGGAIDDESLVAIPTARLRARIESAVAERSAESAPASFTMRNIIWRGGLIAASALVVASFIGWFALRPTPTPGRQRPDAMAQEKESKVPTSNPPGAQHPTTPSLLTHEKGRGKTHQLGSVKKPALDFAQTSLPEPTATAIAPTVNYSEGATFFDFETTRHLEKAQVLLRSFANSSSSSAKELAYDKQVSTELLLRNILLRREAEGS